MPSQLPLRRLLLLEEPHAVVDGLADLLDQFLFGLRGGGGGAAVAEATAARRARRGRPRADSDQAQTRERDPDRAAASRDMSRSSAVRTRGAKSAHRHYIAHHRSGFCHASFNSASFAQIEPLAVGAGDPQPRLRRPSCPTFASGKPAKHASNAAAFSGFTSTRNRVVDSLNSLASSRQTVARQRR